MQYSSVWWFMVPMYLLLFQFLSFMAMLLIMRLVSLTSSSSSWYPILCALKAGVLVMVFRRREAAFCMRFSFISSCVLNSWLTTEGPLSSIAKMRRFSIILNLSFFTCMMDIVVCTSTMSPVLKQPGFVGLNLFHMCMSWYVELEGEMDSTYLCCFFPACPVRV